MKHIIFGLVALAITAGASFAGERTKFELHNQAGVIIKVWTEGAGGEQWTSSYDSEIELETDHEFAVWVKPNWFNAYGDTKFVIPEGKKVNISYTGTGFDLKVNVHTRDFRKVQQ